MTCDMFNDGYWEDHSTDTLKMDGWNTSFLFGWPIFRGYDSFRECKNLCFLPADAFSIDAPCLRKLVCLPKNGLKSWNP